MVTIFSFDHMTGLVLFGVLFCCFLCSRHGCLSAPAIFWWWGGLHSHSRLDTEPSIAAISLTKLLVLMNLIRLWWAQISRYSIMPSGIVWQFRAYWFTVRLRGQTARPWVGIPNSESHSQTVRDVQPLKWSRPRNDPQPWNDPQIDPEMIPTPKRSPFFLLSIPKWSPRNYGMVIGHGTVWIGQ